MKRGICFGHCDAHDFLRQGIDETPLGLGENFERQIVFARRDTADLEGDERIVRRLPTT